MPFYYLESKQMFTKAALSKRSSDCNVNVLHYNDSFLQFLSKYEESQIYIAKRHVSPLEGLVLKEQSLETPYFFHLENFQLLLESSYLTNSIMRGCREIRLK